MKLRTDKINYSEGTKCISCRFLNTRRAQIKRFQSLVKQIKKFEANPPLRLKTVDRTCPRANGWVLSAHPFSILWAQRPKPKEQQSNTFFLPHSARSAQQHVLLSFNWPYLVIKPTVQNKCLFLKKKKKKKRGRYLIIEIELIIFTGVYS